MASAKEAKFVLGPGGRSGVEVFMWGLLYKNQILNKDKVLTVELIYLSIAISATVEDFAAV